MDSFRDSRYKRFVFLGKRTIKEGECMAIWLLDGRQKIVVGPRRKRLWCSNIRFLSRHQVDQHQYIVIYHRSGRREHIRGPYAMFENPVLHQRVEIKNVVSVDGFESLVVYKESEGESTHGQVARRIVRGPCQFVPDANEWVHEFVWKAGAADGEERGGEREIDVNSSSRPARGGKNHEAARSAPSDTVTFTKLRTIPEQLPITTQVRTSNDVVLTVSVMVVIECVDIERMLDSTRDPISDFYNAISADLLGFAAKVSYEKFLEISADMLSNMATFPLLLQRGDAVGFRIHKVVYRGYRSSTQVQELKEARMKIEADMRHEDAQHERKAARLREDLNMEQLVHDSKLKHLESEKRLEEDAVKRTNEQQVAFLTQLKNLNIDVTKYLVSLNDKPDKVIRVEQAGADRTPILINTK